MPSKIKKVPEPSHRFENKPASDAAAARAFGGSWGSHLDTRDRRARTRAASLSRDLKDQS